MSMPLHFPELTKPNEMGNLVPLNDVVVKVAPPPDMHIAELWHYTSASGAKEILASGSLRAGLPTLMNDPQEMIYGAEVIQAFWGENKSQFRHQDQIERVLEYAVTSRGYDEDTPPMTYVLCASSAMDSLAQFRAYGSHSIALNPGLELRAEAAWRSGHNPFRLGWLPVQYTVAEHEAQARRLIETYQGMLDDWPQDEQMFTAQLHVKAIFEIACAYIKAPAYQVENEFRYTITDSVPTAHCVGKLDVITPCVDLVAEPGTDLLWL